MAYEPLFDLLKAKPQESESQESQDMRTISNERSLLAGATPLLMGLLAGDMASGTKVASDKLLGEDARLMKQQVDANKLLAKKSALGDGLKKRYQFIPVQDEKGNITIAKADTFTGGISGTDKLRGYRKALRVNPKTDELVTQSGATGVTEPTVISGSTPTPFDVKSEKDVKQMKDKLMSDPEFKRARSGVNASGRSVELLRSGNSVADEGIKTIFPRMFGEVGNLAYQEQERFSGSPELARKFGRLKSRYLEGKLTDEDRADLLEVAQVMFEYDKQLLSSVSNAHAESLSRQTGLPVEQLSNVIEPFTRAELKKGRVAEKVKRDFTSRLTGDDKSAWEWAMKNKRDPRAKKFIDHIRSKYGE